MSWTAPRTWNPGETVTAALMNAHIRDNLNALRARGMVVQIGAIGADYSPIAPGVKSYLEIPFACVITGWTLVAAQVGSIVIDVWRDSYANFPPTVADTITGSELPTLVNVQSAQDLTLSTWSGAVAAGDVLAINVVSAATVTSVTLTLRWEPS